MSAERASRAAAAEVFAQLEVGPTAVVAASCDVVVIVVEHLLLVVIGVVVSSSLLLQAVRLLGQEVVQWLNEKQIMKYFLGQIPTL